MCGFGRRKRRIKFNFIAKPPRGARRRKLSRSEFANRNVFAIFGSQRQVLDPLPVAVHSGIAIAKRPYRCAAQTFALDADARRRERGDDDSDILVLRLYGVR